MRPRCAVSDMNSLVWPSRGCCLAITLGPPNGRFIDDHNDFANRRNDIEDFLEVDLCCPPICRDFELYGSETSPWRGFRDERLPVPIGPTRVCPWGPVRCGQHGCVERHGVTPLSTHYRRRLRNHVGLNDLDETKHFVPRFLSSGVEYSSRSFERRRLGRLLGGPKSSG